METECSSIMCLTTCTMTPSRPCDAIQKLQTSSKSTRRRRSRCCHPREEAVLLLAIIFAALVTLASGKPTAALNKGDSQHGEEVSALEKRQETQQQLLVATNQEVEQQGLNQEGKNSTVYESEMTTKVPKFGLAWLFSHEYGQEEAGEKRKKVVVDIDDRIRGTWLTFVASKNERRVETGSGHFHTWQPLLFESPESLAQEEEEEDNEGHSNCTKEMRNGDDDDTLGNVPTNNEVKLDARADDMVTMTCSFHNVHHAIDMQKFTVEWMAYDYVPQAASTDEDDTKKDDKKACPKKKALPRLIVTQSPACHLFTEFPFEDLTTSKKNITCTSTLILNSVTVNDTSVYVCRARIAFKAFQDEEKNNNESSDTTATHEYGMSSRLVVRVSRRNDYYVPKVVSLVIGGMVVITLLVLVGKKLLGHKLGWEDKDTVNYAPEWPNGIPARRIASAGSLHHSRSTLRRPSEPCIAEEENEEDDNDDDDTNSSSHRSHVDKDDGSESEDTEEDMTRFLRNVRSSGSFKILVGGDESPHLSPKPANPIHRVYTT